MYKKSWCSPFGGGFGGYIVWRDGEHPGCSEFEYAEAHQVAVFVTEEEAQDYCDYRNEMMVKFSTDAVHKIREWREGIRALHNWWEWLDER